MTSARLMLRRTITSFLSPRFLIGSIGSICVLVVLVVFNSPAVQAVEGTLDLKASTASYSGAFTQAGNQPIRTAWGPLRLDYKSGPDTWTTGLLIREGDGNVTIGAGITSANFNSNSKLMVLGIVESTTGGFKFPDGTTQTSAASAAVGGGWTDGGTSIYTTTSTDSVGIGTTAPGYPLDIKPSSDTAGLRVQGAGIGWGSAIDMDATLNSAGGRHYQIFSSGSGNGDIGGSKFAIRDVGVAGAAGYRMLIDSSGNVGIGSTTPGAKLEVAGNINSSTGALQTAGVTRIDNSGVGTFAAGTTIGGVAPGAETAGQIAFFTTTCPTGWTEYTAARGRVIVGVPLSGTVAGTVGTALTNLEDRTHSHSFSTTTSGVGGSVPGDTCGCTGASSWGTPSHSHSASGTSGTSATSNVIPYIQLTACQKS